MLSFTPNVPVSGRSLDKVLDLHQLPMLMLDGKTILDVGCGFSDIGRDLAGIGLRATVIGIESDEDTVTFRHRSVEGSTKLVRSHFSFLPVKDESVDVVLATYSSPMWARSAEEIDRFYDECARVLKVGGLMSVYPIAVSVQQAEVSVAGDFERASRVFAAASGAQQIASSQNWLSMNPDRETLTLTKLA